MSSHYQNILPKRTSPSASPQQGLPTNFSRTTTTSSAGSSELEHSAAAPKRVSTACSACKARKSKCDGKQPCERCIRHKTDCIIDEDDDLRRRRAVKRKLDDLEADRRLLHALVQALHESTDDSIAPLLALVRENKSLDDLRKHMATETKGSASPEHPQYDKIDGDDHPRPRSPADEPPARRRALEIGNLLNSTVDELEHTHRFPHR